MVPRPIIGVRSFPGIVGRLVDRVISAPGLQLHALKGAPVVATVQIADIAAAAGRWGAVAQRLVQPISTSEEAPMTPFIPLRKADAAQRLVFGRIDETPDRSGEVFDYASSKPEFQAWSEGVQKASDGKSYGNVRAMHGKVAAGKLVGLTFDDAAKSIELCAHIVDDGEWKKVEQGIYTGFSPGWALP